MESPSELGVKAADLHLAQLHEAVSEPGLIDFEGGTGRLISANAVFCSLVGYTKPELQSRTLSDLVHPNDFHSDFAGAAAAGVEAALQDARFIAKDGGVVWASVAITFSPGPSGQPVGTAVVRDMTARKEGLTKAAEAEGLLEMALEASNAGAWSWDARTSQSQWDERYRRMYGLAPDTPATFDAWVGLLHPDDRARVLARIEEVLRTPGDDQWDMEFRSVLPDGRVVWMHGLGHAWRDPGGKVLRLSGINLDITERKRQEETLRESEARLKMAVEASGAGTWSWDARSHQPQWDARHRETYGLAPDEPATFETWIAGLHPEDRPRVLSRVEEVRGNPGDDVWNMEFRVVKPGGSVAWVQGLGRAERDSAGEVLRYAGITFDITERKHSEEALRETEEQLRVLLDRSSAGVAVFDREMRYRFLNRRWQLDYGLTGDAVGRSHYELFPELPERWKQVHRRALAGEPVRAEEDRFDRTDGTVQWLKWEVLPWYTAAREVGGIFILGEDITRRIQAEQALAASEERFRLATETTGVGTFDYDPVRKLAICSTRLYRIFGLPEANYLALDTALGVIHPEDRDGFGATLARALDPGSSGIHDHQYRVVQPDGTTRWVRSVGRTFFDGDGHARRATRLIGTIVDITERKRAEEALRTSNERFDLISRGTNDGIWDWDLVSGQAFVSDRFLDLLGYAPGEVVLSYDEWESRIHPDDRQGVIGMVSAHLRSRNPYDLEYRLRHRDGTYRWFRDRGQAVWDAAGKPLRMAGSISDVTDRVQLKQQVEEALRRTDAELHTIVQAAPVGISTLDRDGNVTTWNRAAKRIFGYQPHEVMGRINPAVPPDRLGEFRNMLSRVLSGETVHVDTRSIRKDGAEIDVSISFAPLRENGSVRGAVVLAEDITEKVNAEAQLARVRAALATAREDEARRIARELHDDIAQRLSALSIEITGAAAAPGAGEHLKSQQKQMLDALEAIRELSHRLHPSILEDLGLRAALDDLCRQFSRSHGLPVWFEAHAVPERVPNDVAACMYRIAQESLRNVAKHAQATDVTVRLSTEGATLKLAVIDSGLGFDAGAVKSGLGLHSMRERAALVNGAVSVESEPGVGTMVVVTLPLA